MKPVSRRILRLLFLIHVSPLILPNAPLVHTRPALTCFSGTTSGEVSEEDNATNGACQAIRIVFGNNYLRPMSRSQCEQMINMKTDFLLGDIIVVKSGNAISSRPGRIEFGICKKNFAQYVERRTDVGREQPEFYAMGILVEIGGRVIRGCNDHIGLRLLQGNRTESETRKSSIGGQNATTE